MSKTAEKLYKVLNGQLVEYEQPAVQATMSKKAYTTEEARNLIGLGRNTFMDLLHSGKIKGIKAGAKWIVPAWAIDEFLAAR